MGDAGAVALAQLLEKNNTIKTYNIQCWYLMHTTAKPMMSRLFLGFGGASTGNGITAVGVQALAQSLKINNTLEHLYLHANAAGDEGGIAMATALEVNHGLTELTLSQNELNGPAYVAFGNMLKSNTTLQSLSLMRLSLITQCFPQKPLNKRSLPDTENNGTAEGAAAFASGLFVNHTLKSLFLHSLFTTQPPPNF